MSKFKMDNDGKIRNCSTNIAKMNVVEHILFKRFYTYEIFSMFRDYVNEVKEFGISTLIFIFNILQVLIFPISFPLMSWFEIRRHRKNSYYMGEEL